MAPGTVPQQLTAPALQSRQAFEEHTLPHLERAYRLACRLTRNKQDAMDIVQEAYLRALRFYRGFHGGDARPWLLGIVRNVFYSSLGENRSRDASGHIELFADIPAAEPNPEAALVESAERSRLRRSIEKLPELYRRVLVLRELEELPYKEIAYILQIPEGTVMSRLSRARKQLRDIVAASELQQELGIKAALKQYSK